MIQSAGFGGETRPSGVLRLEVIRAADLPRTREFRRVSGRRLGRAEREVLRLQSLFAKLERGRHVAEETLRLEDALGIRTSEVYLHKSPEALRQYFRVLGARSVARMAGAVTMDSKLRLIRLHRGLTPEDLGVVSRHVVTTAGVGFMVDAFQNLTELENLKFHGIGTGTNAEASGDTALQTELTTEYNPNNTRATGTTEESAANVFRTDGTNTLDSGTPAVTEHGVLSQAATGGGVLLDRSVFAAVNLVGANGDGLRSIYDLTLTAGG